MILPSHKLEALCKGWQRLEWIRCKSETWKVMQLENLRKSMFIFFKGISFLLRHFVVVLLENIPFSNDDLLLLRKFFLSYFFYRKSLLLIRIRTSHLTVQIFWSTDHYWSLFLKPTKIMKSIELRWKLWFNSTDSIKFEILGLFWQLNFQTAVEHNACKKRILNWFLFLILIV